MKKFIVLIAGILALVSCSAYKSAENPDSGEMIGIGYGSVPKRGLTASVSKVKVNENDYTCNTIFEYLRGRVPGVVVNPDNTILIRGKGSIYSSTSPLILVDGLEVKDISYLNPMDVDYVEVIKDGSAAIYGVRGANGVILITTKKN